MPAPWGEELPQDRALRDGARRLQEAVAVLPLRYAPFFGRLAGMYGITEAEVRAELTRAGNERHWKRTPLPGLRTFELRSGEPGLHARLLRFEPGARFPAHRHRGDETILVLEGAFADSGGTITLAGEQCHMVAGSEHELVILDAGRCVAAVAERGIDFTGPILRLANWLMR